MIRTALLLLVLFASGPAIAEPTGSQIMAVSAPVSTATATVANGNSLSAAVDFGTAVLVGIQTPAAIDSATSLTFQVSYDGTTFANFYDSTGNEVTLTVSTSRSVQVSYIDFVGVRAIKLRLGTSGSPVTATADRVFTLAKRP